MLIFVRLAYHHRNPHDVSECFSFTIFKPHGSSQNREMASIGKGVIFLILFLLWCAYVIIGIFVFRAAEGNVEREEEREGHEQTERWSMSELRAATMQKHNMTAAEFDTLAGKIRETRDDYYDERRWSYGESFWFVFVLLTTIGKKDLTDCTITRSLGVGFVLIN